MLETRRDDGFFHEEITRADDLAPSLASEITSCLTGRCHRTAYYSFDLHKSLAFRQPRMLRHTKGATKLRFLIKSLGS